MSMTKGPLWWGEIQADLSLRVLGCGLAATHVLTYIYWHGATALRNFLSGPVRVCWSFYQKCEQSGFLSSDGLDAYFLFYLILALVTMALFLYQRTSQVACWLLAFVTVLKAAVVVQDYRFMGNYHYMPFWMTVAFLLVPQKKQVGILLIVLFYFAAGLLKLNVEWLSGAAMIRPPMISGKLLEWAVAFVVVLELYLVFWLLSSRLWKRLVVIALLFGFHGFSWHLVGFFYPLVMLSLLAFVILNLRNGIAIDWRNPRIYPLPLLFLVLQFIPLVAMPDSAVTGEGRILALNMFDAKTICQSNILLQRKQEIVELPPLIENLGVRIACDPQVHLAQAKAYCQKLKDSEEEPHISVVLASKSTTASQAQIVLNARDICRQPPEVTWWGGIR